MKRLFPLFMLLISVSIFAQKKVLDHLDYALWNNQLGSVYLAQGDYDKALDAFLTAHYLMT